MEKSLFIRCCFLDTKVKGCKLYCGILKILFEQEDISHNHSKSALYDLCTSLRKRYKILAKPLLQNYEQSIILIMLETHKQTINNLSNDIIEFSENFGIARIASESLMVEDLRDFSLEDDMVDRSL